MLTITVVGKTTQTSDRKKLSKAGRLAKFFRIVVFRVEGYQDDTTRGFLHLRRLATRVSLKHLLS
jgi:hypothetical protein